MIYRNVRDNRLYQYVGVGWMALDTPLCGSAQWTVLLVRDDAGRNHIYAESKDFPPTWVVRGKGTLLTAPDRLIEDDAEMVIYRGEDGCWFVSPAVEFFDGRYAAFSQ